MINLVGIMKNFHKKGNVFAGNDMLVKYDDNLNMGEHWIFRCNEHYGASVIFNPGSKGVEAGLFELAVLEFNGDYYNITYNTHITDDVIGYLDKEGVETILEKIKELA